jgi:putative hydrolase of the HAD superfamily
MGAITTVVSDFGGVLTTPLDAAFRGFVEDTGITLADLGAALMAIGARMGANPIFELELGRLTEADFVRSLDEALTAEVGRPVGIQTFGTLFFRHLHTNDAMFGLMTDLRGRGYRLGLCTNNVREWQPLWRTPEIDALFEVIVDSGFVGYRKPDPEIYELTLGALGVEATEVLFVDDIDINCDAARELGMQAVQFTTNAETIPRVREALGITASA